MNRTMRRRCMECVSTGRTNDATPLHDDPRALGHIYVGPDLKLEPPAGLRGGGRRGRVRLRAGSFRLKEILRFVCDSMAAGDSAAVSRADGRSRRPDSHEIFISQYYHADVFCPEPYDEYPSHLHIDLLPRAQGRGHGAEMVDRLLAKLVGMGSPGVHLGMWIANTRAERFSKRLGFQKLTQVGGIRLSGKAVALKHSRPRDADTGRSELTTPTSQPVSRSRRLRRL